MSPGRLARVPWAGVAALLLPLLLYAATLAPTVTFEDSGEFLTAAALLGVPHPSGFPLWCLLAHAFTWLPFGSLPQRVHLFSAVCTAGAALAIWISARRSAGSGGALVGALGFAVSGVVWSQAVIAEVYPLDLLLTAVALLCTERWARTRSLGWLYALAGVVGLGAATHHLMLLVAPVFLAWALWADWRAVLRPAVMARGALLVAAGLSLYAYLPLRAARDPALDWGHPTTLAAVWAHASRQAYLGGSEAIRFSGGARDVALHSLEGLRALAAAYGPLALLGLGGIAVLWRRERALLCATAAIAILAIPVLNALLDEPYDPLQVFAHRVYYLPAHLVFAWWVAAGAGWLLERARAPGRSAGARRATALGLGALVATTGVLNLREGDRRHETLAREYGLAWLQSLPPGAGLLPFADEVVFPVLYLHAVEGVRPDVHILSPSFGWHGEAPAAVVSPLAPSDALRAELPVLDGAVARPEGLGYRLVPRGTPPLDPADFEPARGVPTLAPLRSPGAPPDAADDERARRVQGDPFLSSVYAAVAVHHARVGARQFARGDVAGAESELDRAEALVADATSAWTVARICAELGLDPARRQRLLERALALYDGYYDPAILRFAPVTRAQIVAALEPGGQAPAP